MKSKCCNKPLRLSRENPEPGETMYYICDGCNQPADPKCDHGDHIMCNECTDNDEYEVTDEQLYAGLPNHIFCKCEHGTPCFDTCFEISKYVDEKVREAIEKKYYVVEERKRIMADLKPKIERLEKLANRLP